MRRWPATIAALVVLAGTAALVVRFPGEPAQDTDVVRAEVPAAFDEAGGAWFCAAADPGAADFQHSVLLAAVADDVSEVRLRAFGAEGPGSSTTVDVPAGEVVEVDVATSLGSAASSVLVESSSAPVLVEHRFTRADGADQAPCSTFASDTWYFPVVRTTRDASAKLSLFNPFPADAAVDIQVAFDSGVRVPSELAGIVVPSGTTKVVDLGASVQRREQFSATLTTRAGRVVAELGQSFSGAVDAEGQAGITGLRLVSGSPRATDSWAIAGGFVDAGAQERLAILNPGEEPVEAVVQVVPHGGLANLPEPFVVEVPALRYAVVDLDLESRVPTQGWHAIVVEAAEGAQVVVARTQTVTAAPADPAADPTPLRGLLSAGTSGSPAGTVAATRWSAVGMPGASVGLVVRNPGDGIAVVDIEVLGQSVEPAQVEIPAGESTVVTAEQLGVGDGEWIARVSAATAVVVERLIAFDANDDFSLQPAIATVPDAGGLTPLGDVEGLG